MAEKILQTRIMLKYDDYENCITNNPVLKKGEVMISAIATNKDGVMNAPSVLLKVGDGVNAYRDLKFVSALAADVIAACKSESALTAFVNNVIAGAGIATDEAMTALAERVTTAEGEIDTLQGLVGDTKVATQITNAITALNLADTYAAKTHTHTKSEITDFAHTHTIAEVTDLSDSIADAKQAGLDATAALNTYKNTNNAAVKANADAIAAINNADTGILAQAKAYADGKDAAIAAAKSAADAAQADVDALEGKVGTVPDDKTIVGMIAEAQAAATYDDTALKGRVSANETAISKLNGLVGDTAVATQIGNAVSAAKTELKGSDADTAASATIAGAKKYADSLDSAMDARVDALEAAVGTGGSVDTKISDAIGKLDKADTAVDGQYVSAVSETDGVITVTRADLPDYTDVYAPKTHTHAIADVTGLQDALDGKVDDADFNTLDGKVTTLIGTDAGKSARTIANEELAAQLIPETAKESLDTLQEIAAWIQAHPDDASAMSAAIDALEEKVGDSAVSAQITSAIDALKAGDIKSATDRIAALEADTHTHANKALLDTYTQTEADLADAVAKKHEHANKAELDKFVDGDKAKLDAAVQTVTAGTGLTATKTGTDVAIGIDDSVVFVFDCGSSSVNV